MKITALRAKAIIAEAKDKAIDNHWIDQLELCMSQEEKKEIDLFWETLSPTSSFLDAIKKIADGQGKFPIPNNKYIIFIHEGPYLPFSWRVDVLDNNKWRLNSSYLALGNEVFLGNKYIEGAERLIWWSPTQQFFVAQLAEVFYGNYS